METLVYMALFSVIMGGAMMATYNLIEGGNRNILAIGVEGEGTFLNRKINWALTGASSASVSPDSTTLTIVRPDLGAQSPLVISGNGTGITIKRGVGAAVGLTNDRFVISNTRFVIQPGIAGRPPSITSSFDVQTKTFMFRTYIRE